MLNKKKKNFSNTIFNQKFLTAIGLVVILLISLPLVKNINQRHKINTEIKSLEKDIKTLENDNSKLKGLINYLESDQFVEEQARLNLGLKKEGEQVIVATNLQDSSMVSDVVSNSMIKIPWLETSVSRENVTNPQRWLIYFFE